MLERYLDDLRRDLAPRLPEEDLQARLAEAESHLREGVEARVELGLSPEDAEREAVAAFGKTERIARSTPPARSSPTLRLALLSSGYGLGVAFFVLGYRLIYDHPRGIEVLFGIWIALGLAFAVVSYRARRPTFFAVLGGGLLGAFVVWLVAGATWLDLHPYGGMGVVPPGEAAASLRRSEAALRDKRTDLAVLESGLKAIKGPRGMEALRVAGGYRAPGARDLRSRDARLTLATYPDAKTATEAWERARDRNGFRGDVANLNATLAAIPQAQAAGLGANLVQMAPSVLSANVGVAVFAALLDLVCASLGAFAARLGRGRGRRGVA